ncbi:unnamed protein product [Closterium sp. NIES-54]
MLLFSLPLSFLAPLSVFPPSSPHRNSYATIPVWCECCVSIQPGRADGRHLWRRCRAWRRSLPGTCHELLGSNSGLARVLCEYSTRAGRWEALVEEVQTIEEVTPRDVQQVARLLFSPDMRITAHAVNA